MTFSEIFNDTKHALFFSDRWASCFTTRCWYSFCPRSRSVRFYDIDRPCFVFTHAVIHEMYSLSLLSISINRFFSFVNGYTLHKIVMIIYYTLIHASSGASRGRCLVMLLCRSSPFLCWQSSITRCWSASLQSSWTDSRPSSTLQLVWSVMLWRQITLLHLCWKTALRIQ